ncbi:MAG: phosphoribosylamine--glycine ligase [Cyanobacteria bacterium J06639_1]
MQIAIVGSGGREHALAWKLAQSERVSRIFCAPGNPGIASEPKCHLVPLSVTDYEGLARFAITQNIGLTVVGPEVPLVGGIADRFQEAGLKVFGPTAEAAQIEGSKAWAKQLMAEAGVPTAKAEVFESKEAAIANLQTRNIPIVVKVDGLAAGKGVTVARSRDEAEEAIEKLFSGSDPETVVIEDFLEGQEASVLAFTDGKTVVPMLPAQDHKPIGEGDTGANTGGMGAYAPAPVATDEVMNKIQSRVLDPTLAALQKRGITYRGVLYAGLMISPSGDPSVVEFNCRFGDPETQAVLPLLESDLLEVMLACTDGRLAEIELKWRSDFAACVAMVSGGYPGSYDRGKIIRGLGAATGALVFHAGTTNQSDSTGKTRLVTDGGRVLGVTGRGSSLQMALDRAYGSVEQIHFDGAYYRKDIGFRAK